MQIYKKKTECNIDFTFLQISNILKEAVAPEIYMHYRIMASLF